MFVQGRERLLEYARKMRASTLNIYKKLFLYGRINYIKAFRRKFLRGKPEGSVIFIVVDCLRYRNVSYAGYHRTTTPFLDSFDVKAKAYAPAPHTYSSVPSILTGLYPHNHGAVIRGIIKDMYLQKNYSPLRKDIVSLPEILRIFGYNTIFITSIYPAILPFKNNVIAYKDLGKVNADKVLNEAFKQIKKSIKYNRPFFAYIHLGDLHEPLRPPKKFENFFGEVKWLPNIDRWAYRKPKEQQGQEFEEYKYNRILLYDNTLRYVDYAVKEFVTALEDEIKSPLLIVITADHGEEFWEHADMEAKYFYHPRGEAGIGHGHNLFNELIEVPLIFVEFTSNRLKRVDLGEYNISTVDILPTILDWLGLVFNTSIFDGYSLFKRMPRQRYIISESIAYGYEKKTLIYDNKKLLYSKGDGIAWVFDLALDPWERKPIMEGDIVSKMVNQLKRILARDALKRKYIIN